MSSFGPQGPNKVFFQSEQGKGPVQPVAFCSTSQKDLQHALALRSSEASRRSPSRSMRGGRSALRSSGSAIMVTSGSNLASSSSLTMKGRGAPPPHRAVVRPPSPVESVVAPPPKFGGRSASILAAADANVFELDGRTPHDVALLDPERPFDLVHYAKSFPEHQTRILKSNVMYTPDPSTGLSKWPIPGMQGSRNPWHELPYAETPGDETILRERWTTVAKADAQKGLGVPKPFKSGKWNGEYTIEQLETQSKSYHESPLMGAMLPGQGYKHAPK